MAEAITTIASPQTRMPLPPPALQPDAISDEQPIVDAALLARLRSLQPVFNRAGQQAQQFAQTAERGQPSPGALGEGELAHRHAVAARSLAEAQHGLQRLADQPALMPVPGEAPPNPADMDASGLVWNSHSDFYKQIGELLGLLQAEWLSKYQDAMATYLEFYKELTAAMELVTVGAANDKGDVNVGFEAARTRLKELLEEYGPPDKDGKGGENPLASFKTMEEAEAFIASIGLPGLTAEKQADGSIGVYMDVSAVESLSNLGNGHMDAAKYNAWVSNKDSSLEQIKNASKVLGEKLGEMTQKFDNVVKILSATIDKITEADMGFVRAL
ncbi:IpaD/SipD/SspD family type III secretion system needle tip protein [uncultured Stenotrophomonas sp.]|uniref:IpaD/SipD/SspD family type III secretion system needle tip protein n=1 Tax=uncultured Stenotrophomonas sp. TaxID=165438 RepID=UPI0025DAC644|nr:IpaD/SipD/SspD family type III secretion system needle tip protein [uncultured Stenotrophomonas sp.]